MEEEKKKKKKDKKRKKEGRKIDGEGKRMMRGREEGDEGEKEIEA